MVESGSLLRSYGVYAPSRVRIPLSPIFKSSQIYYTSYLTRLWGQERIMRVSLFPNSFLSSKQLFYPDKVSSSDSVQFASKDKTKKEITAITPFQPDVFAPRDPALPSSSVEAQHRFAVIGDAGSGAKAQFDIARRMEKVFDKTPYGSVLVLGDNIYENGEPWLFDERIKEPYKNLTKQGVRMMPVMGNHDVRRGFDGAQRTYWGVPEHYKFTIGSAGKDVDVFAIDTTVLLPGYDKCYSDNPFLAKTKADQQMKWLEESLQASTARFKVVMGHYPVYSSGMHGNHRASTLKLRSILEPVLERNNVDAY